MLQFLFDTDHLTLFEFGHPQLIERLASLPPDAVGISAITVEKSMRGRLGVLSRAKSGAERVRRYAHLVESLDVLAQFPIAPYDDRAENEFQRLRGLRLKIGSQDLKIASVALVNSLTLLTRNRNDFGQIVGLVLDDWAV